MHQEHEYTYRVSWSPEDQEYVGTCLEFGAGLSHLDESPEAALSGIMALVRHVLDDMQHDGETPPTPFSSRRYSGRFQVRIPPDQHRELAMQAAAAGVSLNRLASSRLAG